MKHERSCVALATAVMGLVFGWATSAGAQQQRDWRVRLPVGASLTAGMTGLAVDEAGITYVTGISGSSSNTDITTAAYGADGSLRWSRTFNGPANWHDQSRGLALAPGGRLYVTGNTPGPGSYAQVLLLAYDTRRGRLLRSVQYSSGPSASEHGASVAVDGAGNVYVAGGTTGDGGDALVLAFDPSGNLMWQRTWDGPAEAPYSQDSAREILIGRDGNPVVLIHGVMASLHPDYVVIKYAATDGSTIWESNWGVNGEDSPRDMEIDAAGDVYVTGTGLNLHDEFATIKLDGGTGALLWQAYDQAGLRDYAAAIGLDGKGGVYITGSSDPDGDHSNLNDNILTVKRRATDGSQVWTRLYGANCIGCYDVAADVKAAGGRVFVAGSTNSPPYTADAILFVLDSRTGVETDRRILESDALESASSQALRIAPDATLRLGGEMYHVNTGEVDMTVARYTPPAGGPSSVKAR
jgi:hypothetical protein